MSKAKIRVPHSASPELAAAIEAANRGQAYNGPDPGPADSGTHPSHVELAGSADYPQFDLGGTGDHATLVRPDSPNGAGANPERGTAVEPSRVSVAPASSPEMDDLRTELDRLVAQIDEARARADAAAQVEAELRSARAECDQLRVTVKFLKADLAKRAPDADRLRARVAELEQALATARAERERENAEHKRVPAAELERLKGHVEILTAERDAALREAAVARRGCAVHQSEAEGLARDLEQTRDEMGRIANHGVELAEHLHRLGDELERQVREREAERQTHRRALESARLEWEARLRAAELAGRRKTAEETEVLRAQIDEVRHQAETAREERESARRLADELTRDRNRQAGRIAELEAERDAIEVRRLAAMSEVEQLHERIAELAQTRSGAPAPQAEAASARREEERRALIAAAERLARERDNASAQLGETLLKFEDSQGRLEALKGELEAEREARRAEAEASREGAKAIGDVRADAERLGGELEKAAKARAAEAARGRHFAVKAKSLEAELAAQREKYEAELRATQLALEELQIVLKYRQRSEEAGLPVIAHDAGTPEPELAKPSPDRQLEGPDPAHQLEYSAKPEPLAEPGEPCTEGEAADADEARTPLDLAFGPNAAESPDERIAALRMHLRKIHEAEEDRMKNRILRKLSRVWRSDSR